MAFAPGGKTGSGQGLHVIIGLGQPGASKGGMPPSPFSKPGGSLGEDTAGGDEEGAEHAGKKASPEDAATFTPDMQCQSCSHFLADTSECEVVEGHGFGSEITGCVQYFEPAGSEEPESQPGAAPPQQGDPHAGLRPGNSPGGSTLFGQ